MANYDHSLTSEISIDLPSLDMEFDEYFNPMEDLAQCSVSGAVSEYFHNVSGVTYE